MSDRPCIDAKCRNAGFAIRDKSAQTWFQRGPVLDGFTKRLEDATTVPTAEQAWAIIDAYRPYPARRNLAVFACVDRNADGEKDRYLAHEIVGNICMEGYVLHAFSDRYKRCASDLQYLYGLAAQCIAKVGHAEKRQCLARDLASVGGIVLDLFERSGRGFDDEFKTEMACVLVATFLLTGRVDLERVDEYLPKYPKLYLEGCTLANEIPRP